VSPVQILGCGTALLLVGGCSAPTDTESRLATTYRCGDGRSFKVEQSAKSATVDYSGTRIKK
jgi:hypothetical protein